jgi:hypothetical protein
MRQKMVDDAHRIFLAMSEWPREVRLPPRTLTARPLLGTSDSDVVCRRGSIE